MNESTNKKVEYLDWYFTCDDGTADKDAQKAWLELRKQITNGNNVGNEMMEMHTYEALSKEEIMEFFKTVNPSVWKMETRRDPDAMQTIYILRWIA